MPFSNKLPAFVVTTAVLVLAGCTTVAEPVKSQKHKHANQAPAAQGAHKMEMHEKMSSDDMMAMREKMHQDHMEMSKMDMSKMNMSKMSAECQDMMKNMKDDKCMAEMKEASPSKHDSHH